MINITPYPNYIKINRSVSSFSNYHIVIPKKYEKAVLQFNKELDNRLILDEASPSYLIEFIVNKSLKEEQYIIHTDNEMTHVEAYSERGFYYATRTLVQLFDLQKSKKVKKISFKNVMIDDKPRFERRSFMLDESRHFFGKEEVKKYICMLADLKINYFHWHLSDDQGFRIDFSSFPNLASIGAKRSKTKINNQDGNEYDQHEYNYCYSYQEIKDIINFAKKHYVEIIPEIDMPGHTSAIVASYKELHCFDKQIEVATDFGIFKDIMCLGKETSYDFAIKLTHELCILFKDSKYIHIGGDEVNTQNYDKCPNCLQKVKELGLNSTKELQTHFTNILAKHIIENENKKVIMWHDSMNNQIDSRIIMQYWTWEMKADAINIINEGRETTYSPCSQFYFNDPYAELPLIKTYNKGIHLTGLNRKAYKNINGMECCIWNEWITNNKMLEFNTNPRLHAFSEAAWTNTMNHDFTNFVERIESSPFFNYYKLTKAPKKVYLAYGNEYRQKISKLYRGNEKEIETTL